MFERSAEVVAEIARTCVYTLSTSPHTSMLGTSEWCLSEQRRVTLTQDALGLLHDALDDRPGPFN
jgi:hypothetical protein